MLWTREEVVRSYREAADPKKQIGIIAELNAVPPKEIRGILEEEGVVKPETKAPKKRFDEAFAEQLFREGMDDKAMARQLGVGEWAVAQWRSERGLRRGRGGSRGKKTEKESMTKRNEAHPRFTMEPRAAVTVDGLHELLARASAAGYGGCTVTVEGRGFTELWLETHGTIRMDGDGERSVELKGSVKEE